MSDLKLIAELLKKYGRNFFAKCPSYKTAKYKNEYVSLISFDINDLYFYIEKIDKSRDCVKVTELNDFGLWIKMNYFSESVVKQAKSWAIDKTNEQLKEEIKRIKKSEPNNSLADFYRLCTLCDILENRQKQIH